MKGECCHQHPDNGSDLALQTEAQRAETDLRALNAQLLEALEEIAKGEGRFNRDHLIHCENTVENMQALARAAIEAAKGGTS